MIDLEGLATGPNTCILTIAAQAFDPLGTGWYDQHYYARVTLESQENRRIEQGTLAQPRFGKMCIHLQVW